MKLSAQELSFVARRERITRYWVVVGGALLLLLGALGVWLWVRVPYLVDPRAVAEGIRTGTLPESTMALLAAMLPVVVLMLLGVVAVGVLLASVAVSNERRLIRIIQRERAADGDHPSRAKAG
jgi:hypothetical protein